MTVQAKHNQWLLDYSSPDVMCPIFWRDFPIFASDWLWQQSLNVFAWKWSLDVSLSSGVDLLNVNTVKLIHILVSCISKYARTCTLKQGYRHAISDGGKRELNPKKILKIWNRNQCSLTLRMFIASMVLIFVQAKLLLEYNEVLR